MAGRFAAKLLIVTAFFYTFNGCGPSPNEEPQYMPREIMVDATINSVKQAPLAIYNPSSKRQSFRIKSSSPMIFVDPSGLSINAGARELLDVYLICPREVGEHQEEIRITDGQDRTRIIPVDLRCSLAPNDGAATLIVDLVGLPPGEPGELEIQGPEFTSLLLTASDTIAELPIGDYQALARPVTIDDFTFTPLISEQEFTLEDRDTLHITVEYALPEDTPPGALHLTTGGLPDDQRITYRITGPRGFSARFSFPTYFEELPPGAYALELPPEIHAQSPEGHHLYRPHQNPYPLYLPPGGAVEETVHYQDSFLVTAEQDGAPGSLRDLIARAQPNSVISISNNLDEIRLQEGTIPIEIPLTIRGINSPAPITTSGLHGVFQIAPGASLHLQDLLFSNAAGLGHPVIENNGKAHLQDLEIRESADYLGPPAILSRRTLQVEGLLLRDNSSDLGPGAVHIESGFAEFSKLRAIANHGSQSGALLLEGKTTITDSLFAHNQAKEGGAILSRAQLTIKNSAFTLNTALGPSSKGGALLLEGLGRITNTTFLQNTASIGNQIALKSGRLEIAHLTFASLLGSETSHLFIDDAGHLVARNTLFTGPKSGPLSLAIAPEAVLETRGGNFIPAPPDSWPTHLLSPGDLLHLSFDATALMEPTLLYEELDQVLPLPKGHPGRHFIPGFYCRDTRSVLLTTDQLQNERNIDFFCDIGAHQSRTQIFMETFSPTDPDLPVAHGILSTQAGLLWAVQGAYIPDFGALTLDPQGFLETTLDRPSCRLSVIARALSDADSTAHLEVIMEPHNPQETARHRQHIPTQGWRSFGFTFPKTFSTLRIIAPGEALELAALLWSEGDCLEP